MTLVNKYKNIYKIKMCILDFLIISKYFIYFSLFLSCLCINLLNYYVLGKTNNILLKLLYNTINLNGYGVVKITQWYISRNQCFFDTKYIDCLFSNFYENCYIHSINYTKKIFHKEYLREFDNIFTIDESYNIKSGSIAQVYLCYYKNKPDKEPVIMKVVHPEIKYQLYWIEKYCYLYNLITKNIKFLNKFAITFDIYEYFDNIKHQVIMNNEFNNLKYYYEYYKDSPVYIIPQPIFASSSILIMSYEQGISFNDIDASDYIKYKIVLLISIFIKNNYFLLDYIYLDIHSSNWCVQKYKDDYKIIIYDFGYCPKNILKQDIKEFLYHLDMNNIENVCSIIYKYINIIDISQQVFVENIVQLLNKFYYFDNYIHTEKCILIVLEYCNINGYVLHNSILETIISRELIINLCSKSIWYDGSNNEIGKFNKIQDIILNYNCICKKYNIFPELVEYHCKYYLSDEIYDNRHINNNILRYNDISSNNNNITMLI